MKPLQDEAISTAKEKQRERLKRWRATNREHIKTYQKAWREKNAVSVAQYQKEYHEEYRKREGATAAYWKRNLRTNYNMTPDEFNALWQSQNGECAICGVVMSPRGRSTTSVAVDHNHETGAVRGLLCRACNAGIGKLKDDPDILMSAAEYLIERGFYAFHNLKGK